MPCDSIKGHFNPLNSIFMEIILKYYPDIEGKIRKTNAFLALLRIAHGQSKSGFINNLKTNTLLLTYFTYVENTTTIEIFEAGEKAKPILIVSYIN